MPDDLRGKLPDELVDELLAGARTEEEVVGPGGLLSPDLSIVSVSVTSVSPVALASSPRPEICRM